MKRNKTGLKIVIFLIIFLLLAGTLSAIFVYTTTWITQQIEINDLLEGSAIQLSGTNVEWTNVNILPLENNDAAAISGATE